MLVALVGATGNIGPRLVREFSNRGHQVTAVTSHPDDVLDLPGRHTRRGRRERPHDPARLLAGQDVVVSSTQFKKTDHDALSESVTASDVPRYLFNGGSGTLLAPGTSRIMDTRGSRQHSRGRLRPRRPSSNAFSRKTELNWTFLSLPPAFARAGAPASSASLDMNCWSARTARRRSRSRTTRSPSSTRSRTPHSCGSGSRSRAESPARASAHDSILRRSQPLRPAAERSGAPRQRVTPSASRGSWSMAAVNTRSAEPFTTSSGPLVHGGHGSR
jgi:uncharacterized protein